MLLVGMAALPPFSADASGTPRLPCPAIGLINHSLTCGQLMRNCVFTLFTCASFFEQRNYYHATKDTMKTLHSVLVMMQVLEPGVEYSRVKPECLRLQ